MRTHFFFAALLLYFLSVSVFADVGPVRGRVFSNAYVPVSKPLRTPLRQALTSAWIQWDPTLGDVGGARVILTADAMETSTVDPSLQTTSVLRMGVREGYGEYDKNGFQLRVGKQIIPWGKSDAINPTDFLTAKDFSLLNPDEEVRRLGATAVLSSWTPSQGVSPLTFHVVVIPVFAQHKLLIPPSAVPGGVDVTSLTPQPPTRNLSNSETAFKVSYSGGGWDASAMAFRGWNHFPEFAVDSGGRLYRRFQQIRALGSDFSISLTQWVVRGEAAYVWTEYNALTSPALQPSRLDIVTGIERPIADDFRIQLQGTFRHHPDFVSSNEVTPLLRALAKGNQLLTGSQFKTRPGGTVRFSYKAPSSGFEAEIFVMGNVVGGDYLIKPKVSYPWSDSFRTTLGADYYGGPSNLALGSLQVFNSVFAEAKYTF